MTYTNSTYRSLPIWLFLLTGMLVMTKSAANPRELDINGFHYSQNKPPDAETLAIFRGATHVETYRVNGGFGLKPVPQSSSEKGSLDYFKTRTIDGEPITASGPVCGKVFAGQLSAVVSDPKSYARNGYACIMIPGVVFRVWRGKTHADVILCFRCSQIVIEGYDGNGKQMSETSGEMEARNAFAHLAQRAFPKDSELQKL